jgi:peptide/nickel transport system permease protein
MRRAIRRIGVALLVAVGLLATFATLLAPNPPDTQFADRAYAPPTRLRVRDATGFHAPFIFRQQLHDRLMRDYRDDPAVRVTVSWFSRGRLLAVDDAGGPLLLLGADSLGRDNFSRLLHGARLSLGVALVGVALALLAGAVVGGLAGSLGGRADTMLMWLADFVLVLPGAYLVLVLRGLLPLKLSTDAVFWLMAGLFGVSAWPHVARGVRAIVAAERTRDYAEAARAAGAGPIRQMRRLLPASRGFLGVEMVLLLPALLVAEATISVIGLGFPGPTPSWGAMLQEATNISVLSGAPWMLAPAAALFVVALGVHLAAGAGAISSRS